MKQNRLLALCSTSLLCISWPPIPYTSFFLLVALFPLLLAIERLIHSDRPKKGAKIFWLCGFTFFVWNTTCVYWVLNSLRAVMPTWIALLISIIPFGLAALLMTLSFWLYYRLRRIMGRARSYIGLICFWIAYEYLHQSWDLAFPWMNLGNGFAQSHQLVQWYEFTGVYGGTLWILISNILFFETYLAFYQKKAKQIQLSLLSICIGFIGIPVIISLLIYNRYKEKLNPVNVVVVQPNIDPYMKYGSMSPSDQIQKLMNLSDSVGQINTEYFIWPETAIADYVNEDHIRYNTHYMTIQKFLNKYKNGNIISGIESYLLYDNPKTTTASWTDYWNKYIDHFNAAIQIENSDRVQFYHKSKLVPGVEQLPFQNILAFMKPIFASFGGTSGSYGKQVKPSVFYSQAGVGLGPVICYESIWGSYITDYVKRGAQFIAIITNDAWWGDTSGKDQHLEYAKLRAIETRRWVARSANTGISAFINQRGDLVQRSKWWVATALNENINLNDKLTFYVRYGDYIASLGCFGSGVFALFLCFFLLKSKYNL